MDVLNLFFNNDGSFDWRSAAAILSFIGVIITVLINSSNNKKALTQQKDYNERFLNQQKILNIENLKGNIVSKSRIEWIQEVRKKSAEFISVCYELFGFRYQHDDLDLLNAEEKKYILKLMNDVKKNGTLLILYFGPDKHKNNEIIAYIVMDLVNVLTNKSLFLDKNLHQTNRSELDILSDFLRIYFKAEWKRANGELSDEEVQNYLNENDQYSRIRGILLEEINDEYYDYLEDKYERKIPF